MIKINLPSDIFMDSFVLSQEPDNNDPLQDHKQKLHINFEDEPNGRYFSISTERWSIDEYNIDNMIEMFQDLKVILTDLNKEFHTKELK